MTEVTTIKVSTRTRDRLKSQAADAHVSLGEHLEHLAERADRDARLATLRDAIASTSTEVAEGHAAETAEWESAEWTDARDAG